MRAEKRGDCVSQIDLFQLREIDKKIDQFKRLIELNNYPFDLVAVNKYYDSAVIFHRVTEVLHYVFMNGERIKLDYRAPGLGRSFGPNYHLIDQRFSRYESIELTNKKRKYTTCARYELDEYLKNGWFPET